MSGDSGRRLIIIALLAALSAIISYARGYFEEQNGKKLCRDAEAGSPHAKKMYAFFSEKEQKVKDALWSTQMLLLCFEGLIFGVLCHDIMDAIHEKPTFPADFPDLLLNVLVFLAGGLVFAFLYIVFIRRLFAAFGTARGRKTKNYNSYGLIRFLYGLSLPFSCLVNSATKVFVRMLGIGTEALDEDVTQDEILTLVDMGEETGAIESGEKEMIENVLDFTDVTAGDLLTPRTAMTAVPLDISDGELLSVIEETGYSRIPVYKDDIDNIVGILGTKSYLLNRLHKKEEQKSLEELLYDPHFVPESVHATNLLTDMKKNKVHMSVVVDEYGGTAGIITMEDLLEEIVGNIYDETDDPSDEEEGDIVKLEENLWRVKGSADLDTLCQVLGINLPEDLEVETLAGLLFSQLSVIPEDGSTPIVECYGLRIQAERILERRIESALVSLLPPKEEKTEK